MKTILSLMVLVAAGFCISCAKDPPPTQTTIRETRYVPYKPKKPSGPENFEPVNRY